jgi:glutamyl-tRNA reductase
VLGPLLEKLDGRLTDADRAYIEGAFRLFQNRLLHGPIAALQEASREGHSGTLREALMKLFRLKG